MIEEREQDERIFASRNFFRNISGSVEQHRHGERSPDRVIPERALKRSTDGEDIRERGDGGEDVDEGSEGDGAAVSGRGDEGNDGEEVENVPRRLLASKVLTIECCQYLNSSNDGRVLTG